MDMNFYMDTSVNIAVLKASFLQGYTVRTTDNSHPVLGLCGGTDFLRIFLKENAEYKCDEGGGKFGTLARTISYDQ